MNIRSLVRFQQYANTKFIITFNGQIECKNAFLNIGFSSSDRLVEPIFKRAFFMEFSLEIETVKDAIRKMQLVKSNGRTYEHDVDMSI